MISELIQVRPAIMDETGRITQKAVIQIDDKLNTIEAVVLDVGKDGSVDFNNQGINSINYFIDISNQTIHTKEDLKFGVLKGLDLLQ